MASLSSLVLACFLKTNSRKKETKDRMAATLAFLQIPTTLTTSSSKPHSPPPQQQLLSNPKGVGVGVGVFSPINNNKKQQQQPVSSWLVSLPLTTTTATAAAVTLLISSPGDALAAGGEFGILEGRSLALVHPIVMGGLFLYTLYAGYLGWQWRRVRTLQDEINDLKKQQDNPNPPPAQEAEAAQRAPPSPVQLKIQQLSEERKELIKGQYKDKHFNAGSILLGFGVFESIGGGLNTYLRTGKLFPGPHLFAGAAITVLWAAAAALVPPMQKGNETAMNLHIALNLLNVVLFLWQIPTGWDIVLKVLEFTKWP